MAARRHLRRRTAVLLGIALSAALLGTVRATWITASAPVLGGGTTHMPVTGTDTAPAVLALAVVGLAASLATAITSRLIRFVTGPVIALAGIGAAIAALAARSDPAVRAQGAVAERTGIAGGQVQAQMTSWPLLAAGLAVLLAVLGVLVLLDGGSWRREVRYERDAARPAVPAEQDPMEDPAAAWDALSRGEDPSRTGPPSEH